MKMNQEDTSISRFDPLGHPVFCGPRPQTGLQAFLMTFVDRNCRGSTPRNTGS